MNAVQSAPGYVVSPRTNLDSILWDMSQSNLIISDLSDTVGYSPAKAMAYSMLLRPSKLISFSFWAWAIPCFMDLMIRGQEAEEPQWHRFRKEFLHGEELKRQVSWYQHHAGEVLYPGASTFYRHFSTTKKVFLSRDLQPVVDAYASILGFDHAIGECFDEKEGLCTILTELHPSCDRVIFTGDALRDIRTLNELRSYQESGRIKTLVSICVQKKANLTIGEHFDLIIGQDYSPLCQEIEKASTYFPATTCHCPGPVKAKPLETVSGFPLFGLPYWKQQGRPSE